MTPEISLTQAPAHVRHGSNIGQPLTRRDGVLKVKGEARYAADNHPPGMLHAVLAVSSIARGRVTFLDVQAAKGHPGVVDVMTPTNRPPLAEDPDAKTNPFMFRLELLQNDLVRYANQAIAVVIAETLEAATEAAALACATIPNAACPRRSRCRRKFCPARRWRRQSVRDAAWRCGAGSRDGIDAHRRDLRDINPVPQCHGASRHRGGLARR